MNELDEMKNISHVDANKVKIGWFFHGFRPVDSKTAAIAVSSTSIALYTSLIVNIIVFIFFQNNFFKINLIASLSVLFCSLLYALLRFGPGDFYGLEKFDLKRFLIEVTLCPFFVFLAYMGLYLAAYEEMPHTGINVFVVYVLVNALVVAASALLLSFPLISFLRFVRRFRS